MLTSVLLKGPDFLLGGKVMYSLSVRSILGPGACIDCEQGLIKRKGVISFRFSIPWFQQFFFSSSVSLGEFQYLSLTLVEPQGPSPVGGLGHGRVDNILPCPLGSGSQIPPGFMMHTEESILVFKYCGTFYRDYITTKTFYPVRGIQLNSIWCYW